MSENCCGECCRIPCQDWVNIYLCTIFCNPCFAFAITVDAIDRRREKYNKVDTQVQTQTQPGALRREDRFYFTGEAKD